MRRREDRYRREGGLTMIEVVGACAALVVAVGAVATSLTGSLSIWRASAALGGAERRARAALERVTEALTFIDGASIAEDLAPPAGGSGITFRRRTAGGWSPTLRITWQPDPADPGDGMDNSGNGIVDEGMIVLITDPDGPDERREVLARFVAARLEGETENGLDDNGNGLVDERGLSLVREGRLLEIRITTLGSDQVDQPVPRTVRATVAIRD